MDFCLINLIVTAHKRANMRVPHELYYNHHKITLSSWCSISWKLWASWIHNSSLDTVKDLDDNNCAHCKDLQWLNLNGKVRFLWTITTHNNRSFGVLKGTRQLDITVVQPCYLQDVCWRKLSKSVGSKMHHLVFCCCAFSEPYVLQLKNLNKKFSKKICYFC